MTLPRVHPTRVYPTLLGVFLACALVVPAAAQGQPQSKSVAQFGDWSVYVSTVSPKVCYAISQPKTRAPEGLKRDPAFFFVSTRPSENVKNEVTVTMGFPLKEGSDATLTIGAMKLQLYTKNEGAWVRNVADEAKLVDAMRRGKDLTVVSISLRGNPTTDKYSMTGLGQALDRAAQECK
ncbi:invasion associated locus B family protein [Xanthobacter oligotrophicus]|uniref:invasion associated locus B family protein n=1 Tax=Xanthobacter oligotrophicus TaxID=2607286 RepID=UPI0011F3378A|nr:invasion associated locus B family protein [Xanthobacter oligotrophicus]MCG5235511.1 invasion associated locus B family protein [Xanthobacter oligotrophicus]